MFYIVFDNKTTVFNTSCPNYTKDISTKILQLHNKAATCISKVIPVLFESIMSVQVGLLNSVLDNQVIKYVFHMLNAMSFPFRDTVNVLYQYILFYDIQI